MKEEIVQMAPRVLADCRDVLGRDRPDQAVDLLGRAHHRAGDLRADRALELLARGR